jgi:integrase
MAQMLIATRPGELRLAEWQEFDLVNELWTIPMERMKTRKHMTEPHVVTLSRQAVKALEELKEITGYSKFLFPSLTSSTKPISDMTLAKALRAIWPEYRVVPHGFRHFFSTMTNEHGRFRPDVIEAALVHKDGNAIRAVYNRATYIKERLELAQWWADELEAMRDGGKVVPFKSGVA